MIFLLEHTKDTEQFDALKKQLAALEEESQLTRQRLSSAHGEIDKKQAQIEHLKINSERVEQKLKHDLDQYEHDMQKLSQQCEFLNASMTSKEQLLAAENLELQAQLKALSIQSHPANPAPHEPPGETVKNNEVSLRLELDRLQRTLGKERKIHKLQAAEHEDRISELQLALEKAQAELNSRQAPWVENDSRKRARTMPTDGELSESATHDSGGEVKENIFAIQPMDPAVRATPKQTHPERSQLTPKRAPSSISKIKTPEACRQQ